MSQITFSSTTTQILARILAYKAHQFIMQLSPTTSRRPLLTNILLILVISLNNTTLDTALAQDIKYISDKLEITLRTGQSTQHQIIRMLRSGTSVEVLEQNTENGYTQVRLKNGAEGWVLSRFLMKSPDKRAQLDQLQKNTRQLKTKNQALQHAETTSNKKYQQLAQQLKQLQQKYQTTRGELLNIQKISGNALTLASNNKVMGEKIIGLKNSIGQLKQENLTLKDRKERDWFIIGAGVLFLGLISGLIITKIRWRRRSSWSSL